MRPPTHEHVAGGRHRAEPRGQVQRCALNPSDRHSLPCCDADPDEYWQRRLDRRFLGTGRLKLQSGPHSLRRDAEDGQRLYRAAR